MRSIIAGDDPQNFEFYYAYGVDQKQIKIAKEQKEVKEEPVIPPEDPTDEGAVDKVDESAIVQIEEQIDDQRDKMNESLLGINELRRVLNKP